MEHLPSVIMINLRIKNFIVVKQQKVFISFIVYFNLFEEI